MRRSMTTWEQCTKAGAVVGGEGATGKSRLSTIAVQAGKIDEFSGVGGAILGAWVVEGISR